MLEKVRGSERLGINACRQDVSKCTESEEIHWMQVTKHTSKESSLVLKSRLMFIQKLYQEITCYLDYLFSIKLHN